MENTDPVTPTREQWNDLASRIKNASSTNFSDTEWDNLWA